MSKIVLSVLVFVLSILLLIMFGRAYVAEEKLHVCRTHFALWYCSVRAEHPELGWADNDCTKKMEPSK